jgi:CDP-paratose 2-epimerase
MEQELAVGRWVWTKLPYGDFIIGDNRDVVLFAGGTGITAFSAFLDGLSDAFQHHVTLFYGARTGNLLLYREMVEQRVRDISQLQVYFYIETPKHDSIMSSWVTIGRLSVYAAWRYIRNPFSANYYLSGPPQMLKAISQELLRQQVTVESIHVDAWDNKAMSWLITGGCGFVGSNLADTLLSKGEEVVILDNLSRMGSRDNLSWLRSRHGNGWRFVEADIRDADGVANLVKETQTYAIAHLAGQVAMTTSLQNPRLDFEVNAIGTLNVLEAVRLYSPTTITLYSSTNKVYGALEDLRCEEAKTRYILPDYPYGLDETLPIVGHSPYGCSKLTADQYVRDYSCVYGIRTVVFRHSSMYGGRQFATFDQGWIVWFCLKALEMLDPTAPEFTIAGNGKQVRDILHADDFVNAYLLAVQNIQTSAGQIYNLGGGPKNSLSLLELFEELEMITGCKMRFRCLDWRLGDQKIFVADYRKAWRDLGWEPKVSARAGLYEAVEWSRSLHSSKAF